MWLKTLRIEHFRNHNLTNLAFTKPISIFYGLNGQGKTSLLDSIYFLALSKSFLTNSDIECINLSQSDSILSATFESFHHISYQISSNINRQTGKSFLINNQVPQSQSDLFGTIPITLLSLEDRSLSMDGPVYRRRFMDQVLFQVSKAYVEDSKNLKRILKQRNELLSSSQRQSSTFVNLIDAWTTELIQVSKIISKKRLSFINDLRIEMNNNLQNTFPEYENFKIDYVCNGIICNHDEEIDTFYNHISSDILKEELDKKVTLFGPQRDDIRIFFNNRDARKFASQGQHKVILLFFKIAQFFYLKNKLDEPPIFLIDDIFSELDKDRMDRVIHYLPSLGQVFITVTNREPMLSIPDTSFFEVKNGGVKENGG